VRIPRHLFKDGPPRRAEQLETRELGLDGDARVRGGVEEGEAVGPDGGGSRLNGI
jgi:hypothetical protein